MGNVALDMTKVHPLNPYRPPAAPGAFRVKKWKPTYDMIVAGHIMGKSNKELATEFDFTPVHIANILRSDHAQTLIAEASTRIREAVKDKAENTVELQEEIKNLALKRQKEFLENDELVKNSPFHFVDRAIRIASPAPVVTPSPNVSVQVQNNNNNSATINGKEVRTESLNRIAEALEIVNG